MFNGNFLCFSQYIVKASQQLKTLNFEVNDVIIIDT